MSTAESPGCVILLIDESAAMDSPVEEAASASGATAAAQSPKSKSQSVATAVNAMIKRLSGGPDFDLAIVGYQTQDEESVVDSRWDGPLKGRTFVPVREVADAPAQVEERVRKLPNPAGIGPPVEQTVEFPVWYSAQPGGKACQVAAFNRCCELLEEWKATSGDNPGTPLIMHLFAAGSNDGNPHRAIQELMKFDTGVGQPVVAQARLSTSKTVPPTLYPSNRFYLLGSQKDLFARCSPLPEELADELRTAGVTINPKAVCMLDNARMLDVVQLLKLVDAHTRSWPSRQMVHETEQTAESPAMPADVESESPEPAMSGAPDSESAAAGEARETAGLDSAASAASVQEGQAAVLAEEEPGAADTQPEAGSEEEEPAAPEEPAAEAGERERAALLIFALDRSLSDPFDAGTGNSWSRLQENANNLIESIARKPTGVIDLAVVSYCTDVTGDVDVRVGFEGVLAGQKFVKDTALMDGALRIDEFTKKVPDGVGGLMERPVKQPVFLELEPGAAAPSTTAFDRVGELVSEWSSEHPNSLISPIVIHFTRGQLEPEDIETAASSLNGSHAAGGSVLLHHLIATEDAHASVVFPEQLPGDEPEGLQALFQHSSPLPDVERLSAEKPALVKPESKGFVINGKIDLVPETFLEMLTVPD